MKTLHSSAALAALCLAAAISTAGIASASTHHAARSNVNAASHAKYASACTALADQWTQAKSAHTHGRHLRKAEHQERLGERDCKSDRTAHLKSGTAHYRSALRLLGVKPQA